jgi:hypothetical protein
VCETQHEVAFLSASVDAISRFTLVSFCFGNVCSQRGTLSERLTISRAPSLATETYQQVKRVYKTKGLKHVKTYFSCPHHATNKSSPFEIRLE